MPLFKSLPELFMLFNCYNSLFLIYQLQFSKIFIYCLNCFFILLQNKWRDYLINYLFIYLLFKPCQYIFRFTSSYYFIEKGLGLNN